MFLKSNNIMRYMLKIMEINIIVIYIIKGLEIWTMNLKKYNQFLYLMLNLFI